MKKITKKPFSDLGNSAVQEEMGGHGSSAESSQFLYSHHRLGTANSQAIEQSWFP